MQEKPCESVVNCPYSRQCITYKVKKRKRGDKTRERPEIASVNYYCLYQKEKTEITSDNRHKLTCYYEK